MQPLLCALREDSPLPGSVTEAVLHAVLAVGTAGVAACVHATADGFSTLDCLVLSALIRHPIVQVRRLAPRCKRCTRTLSCFVHLSAAAVRLAPPQSRIVVPRLARELHSEDVALRNAVALALGWVERIRTRE